MASSQASSGVVLNEVTPWPWEMIIAKVAAAWSLGNASSTTTSWSPNETNFSLTSGGFSHGKTILGKQPPSASTMGFTAATRSRFDGDLSMSSQAWEVYENCIR